MMRRWVERGVDGFRMDVINLISKDPTLPDGTVPPGKQYASSVRSVANGPRLHEFLAEMNREVGLAAQNLLTVGEMPGSTIELARERHRPRRATSSTWSSPSSTSGSTSSPAAASGRSRTCRCRCSRATSPTWQRRPRRRRLELALLGQPRPAAGGLAVRRRQPRAPGGLGQDARHGAAPAPRHAVRLPGRGARDDEQLLHRASTSTTTSSRSTTTPRRSTPVAAGRDGAAVAVRSKGRDNARTPMQWDDSEHAGFTTGHAVAAGATRTTTTINAARRGGRPGLGVPPLPAADRAAARRPGRGATAASSCCCPTTSSCGRSPGRSGDDVLLVRGQLLVGAASKLGRRTTCRTSDGASCCSAPTAGTGSSSRPGSPGSTRCRTRSISLSASVLASWWVGPPHVGCARPGPDAPRPLTEHETLDLTCPRRHRDTVTACAPSTAS